MNPILATVILVLLFGSLGALLVYAIYWDFVKRVRPLKEDDAI